MHSGPIATASYEGSTPLQSSYSSPTLSATSSSPFISLVPFHSLDSAHSHTTTASGEVPLVVGSRIRVRGAEFLPPKLSHYAHSPAEVAQLPSHPNTWFEIKLQDGKQVKMRKTAFDAVATNNNNESNHGGYNVATLNAYNLQQHQMQFQQQQPQPMHGFASHYSYPHQQQQQQQQHSSHLALPHQQQQQQQHKAVHQQQPTYFSPSPTSSATHSPALSSSSVPVPYLSKLTLDQHSSDEKRPNAAAAAATQPASAATKPMVALPQAPARVDERMSTDSRSSESAGSGSEDNDDIGARSRGVSLTTTDDGTTATAPQQPAPLVLNSKRKPVPRALSPEAEPNDSEVDEGVSEHDQDDQDDEDHDEDDEDEEDDSHSRASSNKKSSSAYRPAKNSSATKSATAGNKTGTKSTRSRRGRGRALLGLNVVVLGGRYLGETGLVVRGANGYYSVKFHRPMPDLRAPGLDNTAMKRSSELAPITAQGKRLQLPLPPAQRKIMKQEATAGVGKAAAALAMSSVKKPSPAEASPSLSGAAAASASSSSPGGASASNKRKIAFPVSSRRTAVYRRRDSTPKASHQQHDSDTDSHSDCSSSSSRSGSPALESASGSDGEGRRQNHRENARGRRGHSDWHRHRHHQGNDRSDESVSPARTVLLSPALKHQQSFPPSPSVHGLPTPISSACLSARSPSLIAYQSSPFLAPMSLPPTHFNEPLSLDAKNNAKSSSSGMSKSANMRAPSPGIKQAACILLALSHEGSPEEQQPQQQLQQPMQVTYSLTHIKPHPVTDDPQLEGVLYTGVPWTM